MATSGPEGPFDEAERRALIAEVAFQRREADARLSELEQVRAELRRLTRSGGEAPKPRWQQLRMPAYPVADVSLVVVSRSGAQQVERCLRAIVAAADAIAFETILVDAGGDPETAALLDAVDGVRVVTVAQGESLAGAVNRAAATAAGRHLVLLAGDAEPARGWLDALVGRADSAADAGVVAAKVVDPGGDVRSAGAIAWQDGGISAYGERRPADAPQLAYVREVDYGPAAALLVRRELWTAIDGFDERLGLDGYADADLGFAARGAGWRVLYEPRALAVRSGDEPAAAVERSDDRQRFAEKWAAALGEQPAPARGEYLAGDRRRGPHVLVVDHALPMPDRDSGSVRMWHIVRQLVEIGCRVTFMSDTSVTEERYRQALQDLGVEALDRDSDLAASMIAAAGETRLAILSRPHVASRYFSPLRELAPAARIAYDTVDLHYVRERRRAQQEGDADLRKSNGLRELELAMARACDVTLVISEDERRTLLGEDPGLAVEVLPQADELAAAVPPRSGRAGVLFVGGFAHSPNRGAAIELAEKVMPAVWAEIEDVSLTVVGSGPPPELLALAADRVDVRGWVPDIRPLLDGSVAMVAPLRYGAGVKGKIVRSMAVGLPVVTTAVGAEGIAVEHGRDILIGDDPEEIARQIVALHRDAELWSRLSGNGREVVDRTCSPAAQRRVLERLLGDG